jgi:hypothetical protein
LTLPSRGRIQITFDARDPVSLAKFWAEALRYPPPDVEGLKEHLREAGEPDEKLEDWAIIGDGVGPRVFFQKVPESKVAKNRVHLDIRAADTRDRALVDTEVSRLIGLGAKKVAGVEDLGSYFVVMQDPEGNEFCID